jgi:hypothetical protein
MKKNIDITGAMAAEAALARKEAEELERDIESLPDDHPLKLAALEERRRTGGDLAALPSGHPLLMEMEAAKIKHEERERLESEDDARQEEREQIKLRKAKKLNAKKAAAERRIREDERESRLRNATKRINSSMSDTMDSLRILSDNVEASKEDFRHDNYATMKLDRLNRLIVATMRGISESKISAGRVVSGG